MIQAAPLVLSFARAVPMLNKLIGAVGITELGNRVNNYIQENPDESEKIVSMIMPTQGIANALKNKSSEDVEEVQESEIFMNKEKISLEDLDEMTDEEAADLPDEDKAELMKQAGKKRDRELSIATSEKLGLSGPGKEKIDIEREIDERVDPGGIQKEKKGYDFRDYIPKGAYKKRYADGGAIGIEVLFEEKKPRKDFNIGGNVQRVTTPQPYDARASAADFARAIDRVGAGTDMQKAMAIQEYGQNVQRQNMRGMGKSGFQTQPGTFSQLGNQAKNYLSKQLTTEKLIPGLQPSIDNLQNVIDSSTDQNDYFRKSTSDMIQKLSEGYGKAPIVGPLNQALIETTAPVLSAVTSPFYDGYEAYKRMEPGSGISGFAKAFDNEQPLDAIANRFIGAAEPLANRITNVGTSIGEGISNLLTPTYDSASAGAIITDGDSKYRINADGSRSLIGKVEDAPIIDRPTMADVAGPAATGGGYAGNTKNVISEDPLGLIQQINKLRNGQTPTANYSYQPEEGGYVAWNGTSYTVVSPDQIKMDIEALQARGLKDGGRVGLFMGGPALEGQALSIYDSMKAYGFSDQEIANALSAQGLYTPGSTPVVEEPVTNTVQNIINQGGRDGPPNDPPKDPYGGLGYSSANFGLGKGINKDAVMDYEADAYEQGRTFTGQLNKIGLGIFSALKNIPTPFNLVRMGIQKTKDIARQKEIEKEMQQAAIARDIARSNKAAGTGGYQAGYGGDFMDGPSGAGYGMGSADKGGSDSMGSFKRGGLATMFVEKR